MGWMSWMGWLMGWLSWLMGWMVCLLDSLRSMCIFIYEIEGKEE